MTALAQRVHFGLLNTLLRPAILGPILAILLWEFAARTLSEAFVLAPVVNTSDRKNGSLGLRVGARTSWSASCPEDLCKRLSFQLSDKKQRPGGDAGAFFMV